MKKYKYILTFYDYWHSGSGLSGGVRVDKMVLKDKKNGLPFVSGKTIKGLLREFANDENCFGKKGIGEEIKSIFSDAKLLENHASEILEHKLKNELYDTITTTSIDNSTGVAKTDTLRSMEVVIPLKLEGEIEIYENCKDTIEKAMSKLKRLGSGRNRGLGRCKIELGKEIIETTSTVVLEKDKEDIYLKCIFEDDIVLLGSANTEGKSKVLDFIPGSTFVGIAAKGINDKNCKNLTISFEELLNGSICFTDASLLSKKNKPTYHMPLSFFKPKIAKDDDEDSKKIYNFPFITDEDHENYQMQQQRSGYITIDGSKLTPEYDYQQKSAHDSTKRRSAKSEMYGYPAIVAGTEWVFSIKTKDSKQLEELVKYLTNGSHRLGKSKSAQYGKVRFEEWNGNEEVTFEKPENEPALTLLYAKSRLSLFDPQTGQPTFEPSIENLGLKSGEIDWENTQIRTTTFTPYNGAQKTATYERIVIEKGSVIAINDLNIDVDSMHVGAYKNEGFGEILVNPSFLAKKHIEVTEDVKEVDNSVQNNKYEGEDKLLCYLQHKKDSKDSEYKLVALVDGIEEKLDGITNSQWGVIRSMVSKPTLKDIKTEIDVYVSKGKTKDKWITKKNIIFEEMSKLSNEEEKVKFIKLLTMRMQSKGVNS